MSSPAAVAPLAPPQRAARRRPTLFDAIAWEMTKLTAQARARLTLLICLIAPVLIVIVINGQQRPPKDSLFGRYIHQSGYAVPLLVLGFAAQWVLPLLTALVAGDIFASEDQHGTWKTVLTRSASRAQLFWAKTITALAFATAVLAILAASTIVAGILIVGHQDLTGLSGQLIPSSTAARLVIASWATALAPMLGFTCLAILLSVRSRNPAFGIAAPVVIGMVMQLAGTLGGVEGIRPLLLTTPFESWHGLLAQHQFYAPLIWGFVASAGWCVVCLTTAFISLRRRDIAGG
ncbi:ABC transporter permease [Candidatus Solirubrobacter pratensis]|uniref:ABC transporter permease n=1 Tax=Candidatus Solirubrobacter pratensis TaxID=1298857 RepID=UPI0003FC1F20|nr:ABC transporter permease [Candidatus Solirubrobacter pratensis]